MAVDYSSECRDLHLVERIACGDEQALRMLFERHRERVLRYCLRLINRMSKAEEVTNDVMLAVWNNARRFEGRSKVSTWIIGIARNAALNAVRGKRLPMTSLEQFAQSVDYAIATETLEAIELTNTRYRTLCKALGSLSIEHRDVIELTFYHGFSYPEIAKIVGCPENTIKTRMFHAKRKLRRVVENGDYTPQ